MDTIIGHTIGNFHVEELIAKGGAGAVYKARDMSVNRLVAIKIILPQFASDNEFIHRFESEAQTVARLEHPHIVPLYSFLRNDDRVFFVMRYLEGGSLRDLMKQQGALSLAQSLRILRQICNALSVTHENGIIHRDLKPENIMLDKKGNAYLSDFGIAKDINHNEHQTNPDSIVGTLAYLAPEQIREETLTGAVDIYALALVTYEMLAGKHPFTGTGLQLVERHLTQDFPALSEVREDLPLALDAVLQRGAAKDCYDRYNNIDAFMQALDKLEHQSSADTHETGLTFASSSNRENAVTQREKMLKLVHDFWIRGILRQSVHRAALMELGFQAAQEAVENPWNLVLKQTNQVDAPLNPQNSLLEVFDTLGGKMLILGVAGSGKTTSLLQLSEALLQRAAKDQRHPIPVVFNLASWGEKRVDFEAWLYRELLHRYRISPKLASQWIEEDSLLLLLDGLDEVEETARRHCVDTINQFRLEHGFVDMVVTSRSDDYYRLTNQLMLNGAVIMQALTDQQIETYLGRIGTVGETLRTIIRKDSGVRDLARIPLLLNLMSLAYPNTGAIKDLLKVGSIEEQRYRILEHFVDYMFQRHKGKKPYSLAQTKAYLKWLAEKMRWHGDFLISTASVQARWLPSFRLVNLFTILVIALNALPILLFNLIGLYTLFGASSLVFSLMWTIIILVCHFFSTSEVINEPVVLPSNRFHLGMIFTHISWLPNFLVAATATIGLNLILRGFVPDFSSLLTLLISTLTLAYSHAWASLQTMQVCKHIIIRLIFLFRGEIPLQMTKFLGFASELLYMRRVGNTFTFTHRYILDYFADYKSKKAQ